LRTRLWENARRLYQRLNELNFRLGPEVSPIVAVRLANPEEAVFLWNGLLERGVYVNLVLPPATPDGGALLRCSVSAGHTPEQVDRICEAFTSLRQNVQAAQRAGTGTSPPARGGSA
jgi:8-amino-7-oxononanoate synthase